MGNTLAYYEQEVYNNQREYKAKRRERDIAILDCKAKRLNLQYSRLKNDPEFWFRVYK